MTYIGSASNAPSSIPTRTICIVSTADSNGVGAIETSGGKALGENP
jgi:hypothetical protein